MIHINCSCNFIFSCWFKNCWKSLSLFLCRCILN